MKPKPRDWLALNSVILSPKRINWSYGPGCGPASCGAAMVLKSGAKVKSRRRSYALRRSPHASFRERQEAGISQQQTANHVLDKQKGREAVECRPRDVGAEIPYNRPHGVPGILEQSDGLLVGD